MQYPVGAGELDRHRIPAPTACPEGNGAVGAQKG